MINEILLLRNSVAFGVLKRPFLSLLAGIAVSSHNHLTGSVFLTEQKTEPDQGTATSSGSAVHLQCRVVKWNIRKERVNTKREPTHI